MTPQQAHNHLPRPAHKEPPAHAPNAALMIDFDNVTMAIRSDLQTELKRLLQSEIIRGKVAVQRAYADWRRYPQYIVPLSESSIDLIFAPAHGANKKNATDIRLAIDALELVFTRPEIGTFILLSGDSDFSSLVLKLKEYGKYVIGVGIRESSSDLLIQNCDEYYSYNELAGFTKTSDVEYVKRDPWELVVEAVKQMTAHNDVMRSDRLKQVMQEIDPNFDEKDAGFSRFSKFVIEAARRGLITLTRLDNGQYEIALGPQVAGAAAQPGLAALSAASEPPQLPAPSRSRGGRGRGRGRGGQGGGREAAQEVVTESEAPATPAAKSEGGFSFGDAFGFLKQAMTGSGEAKSDQAAPPAPPAPPAAAAPASDVVEDEDDIPMPTSSAPPPPYSTPATSAPGIPMRSARFRRGSRGGGPRGPASGTPDIPRIGVVEVDPHFRPRGDVLPPKPPVGQSPSVGPAGPAQERSERGGRGGRGGRGRGRGQGQGENGERGERGERGGRGRRGGRGGRGRGPRRFEGETQDVTNHNARPVGDQSPPREPPERPAPPPPPAAPPAPDDVGESFWSKVKRGLTGGG